MAKSSSVMKVVPDKGWAWLVCFVEIIIGMIISGTARLQGVLFIEYLELFNQGVIATSWFSFIMGIATLITAPIGGYMADEMTHNQTRILLAALCITASTCVALAGYMPNLPLTTLWFGLLGACLGLVDAQSLSLLNKYFDKLRTLAFCIAFCGGPLGSIVMPLLFAGVNSYGFRGKMLLLSGVWLQSVFVPFVTWPLSKTTTVQEGKESCDSHKPKSTSSVATIEGVSNNYLHTQVNKNGNDNFGFDDESCTTPSPGQTKTPEYTDQNGHKMETSNPPEEANSLCCNNKFFRIFRSYAKFFKTPRIPLLFLACLFGSFGLLGGYFLIPLLAQEMGMSKFDASLVLTAGSVCELVLKPLIGILADKYKIPKVIILIVCYVISGTVGIVISFVDNPQALYVLGVVIGGFGGPVFGLTVPILVDAADESQKGTASGMFTFIIGLSGSLVPVILGWAQTYFGSFRHALRVQSAAFMLGILCCLGNYAISNIRRLVRSKTFKLKQANQA